MDLILRASDEYILNWFYTTYTPGIKFLHSPSSISRQCLSLWIIAIVGVTILYFTLASFETLISITIIQLSNHKVYFFLYDKHLMKHPKFLKNQIRKEIALSLYSFPITSAVTVPWFLFEVRGYSKLYHDIDQYGWPWFFTSIVLFILFTDFGVYWIHRFEHHPILYSWLHKGHHAWKVSTPFAAFAFHPLDGYFQSIPMHLFVYLFPMNSYAYLAAFVFIQMWTVSIHDGIYIVSHPWINSSAHHTVHHLEFNYNYGQYFTLWDRIGGSYKRPTFEFENNMFFEKIKYNKHAQFESNKKEQ